MDPKQTMVLLKQIGEVYGPFLGTMLLLMLAGISLILVFFKRRVEKIAEDISAKAMETYKAKQQLSIRDEATRRELTVFLGKKSIETKLRMYERVYRLYFRYQTTWELSKDIEKNKDAIQKIWSRILSMRREVFMQSVYLGGPLTDCLMKAVIAMWSILEDRISQSKSQWLYDFGVYSYPQKDLFKSETQLTDYLDSARKYVTENLHSHQDISQYDFTPDQKRLLEEERDKILRE